MKEDENKFTLDPKINIKNSNRGLTILFAGLVRRKHSSLFSLNKEGYFLSLETMFKAIFASVARLARGKHSCLLAYPKIQ
jgi:hypothetical protein